MTENAPLDLLTPEDVSVRFKLSIRTVRFYCQTGQLPAIRIGRQWRFRAADLSRYLDKHLSTAGKRNGSA